MFSRYELFRARSDTFQFAQKALRSGYIEESAEIAQNEIFPTAMLSSDVDRAIATRARTAGDLSIIRPYRADRMSFERWFFIPLSKDKKETD